MPSSLVMRMRIYRVPGAAQRAFAVRCRPGTPVSESEPGSRNSDASLRAASHPGHELVVTSTIPLDLRHATHIRLERVRHRNRAILLLIGFHHRDQRAADRNTGAVERVHVAFYLAIL